MTVPQIFRTTGAVTLAVAVTGLMFAALLLGGPAAVTRLADCLSGGDGDA